MFDKNVEALVVRENVDTTRAMTPRAVDPAGHPAAADVVWLRELSGVARSAGKATVAPRIDD